MFEATFGASVRRDRSHMRTLRVAVRVGSHDLDNSEFLAAAPMFSMRSFPRSLVREDDYDALRHDLWLATDAAYKEALEQLARKRAFIQNRVQDEPVPDFSVEEAVVLIEPPAESRFDEGTWQETVRNLSEVFREYPAIDESSVTLRVERANRYLVNSDGSMVRRPGSLAVLYARAATRAPDGMRLKHFVPFYERAVDDLPAEAEMEAAVRRMATELAALTAAPVLDDYIGPVLVSGQASSELFAQVLGTQLSGHRPSLLEDEDPTRETFAGEPLVGSYAVDDQGVRAQPVTLVEGGVLRTLLMSRRPREGILQSNGHGRARAFGSATAQPGDLFIRAEGGLSEEELKEELIALARDTGLTYGVLVKALDDPRITGTDPSSISSIFLMLQGGSSPLLASSSPRPWVGLAVRASPRRSSRRRSCSRSWRSSASAGRSRRRSSWGIRTSVRNSGDVPPSRCARRGAGPVSVPCSWSSSSSPSNISVLSVSSPRPSPQMKP